MNQKPFRDEIPDLWNESLDLVVVSSLGMFKCKKKPHRYFRAEKEKLIRIILRTVRNTLFSNKTFLHYRHQRFNLFSFSNAKRDQIVKNKLC